MASDSSYFRLLYVDETTFGTTPTNPNMKEMRINGESVNFSPKYTQSKEIRSDRQVPDLVQVGAEVSGDIPFELSYGSYDDWFEYAFFSDWTTAVNISGVTDIAAVADDGGSGNSAFTSSSTDFSTAGIQAGMWVKTSGFSNSGNNGFFQVQTVAANKLTLFGSKLTDEAAGATVSMKNGGMLQNGTTKKSVSLEKQFTDEPLYQVISGVRCSGFELNFQNGSILEGKFSVMGIATTVLTSVSIATSITAADTNEKMNSVADLTNIEKDDTAVPGHIMKLSVTLDNGLRGQPEIGTLGYFGIGAGRSSTKGSIIIYLDSMAANAFYNAGMNNTAFKLSFRLTDNSGNAYIITLYRMKLDKLSNNADSIDKDVMIDSGYQAIMDSSGVSGKTIQIDRFPA